MEKIEQDKRIFHTSRIVNYERQNYEVGKYLKMDFVFYFLNNPATSPFDYPFKNKIMQDIQYKKHYRENINGILLYCDIKKMSYGISCSDKNY